MKKYAISIIATIISVWIYFYMNPSPKKVIETHLKNKYKEEFVVELLGKRDKTYEAIVYPQKYVGTPKENDSYYWGRGFAKGRNGGDTYGLVLLNESTNEFFLPKLKELFGENVLPIFNMGPGYIKNNFKEEIELMKKAYKKYPTANFEPISGGIYIFGRVENDEDREWYRKQIYEFVQFMKQTGTFEYVSLGINIVDERCLTDYFKKNIANLLEAKQKYDTSSEFIIYRDKIFKEAEKEFKQMSEKEKQKRINEFNKSSLLENDIEGYGVVYHAGILSPKFKDSEPRAKSKRKEYNDIKDVELLNTMKILYMEYYRKEDGEIVEK